MTTDPLKALEADAHQLLQKYDKKHAAVIPLLHMAQDKVGQVTPEVEAWVSRLTEVPVVHVHEVVTFYSMFHTKPVGRHHIRFCSTTSCVLAGSETLSEHLKNKLSIQNGQTTPDGKISLEESECLCACEMAPMMQVDGVYHGNLTPQKMDSILEGLK